MKRIIPISARLARHETNSVKFLRLKLRRLSTEGMHLTPGSMDYLRNNLYRLVIRGFLEIGIANRYIYGIHIICTETTSSNGMSVRMS